MFKDKELEQLIVAPGQFQFADPLTKLGANGKALSRVMQEGKIPKEILAVIKA